MMAYGFVTGALVMCLIACCLLFIRLWRRTRDRLFGLFGVAFAMLAVNRAGHIVIDESNEIISWWYLIRLAAFIVIIYAVIEKNMRKPKPGM